MKKNINSASVRDADIPISWFTAIFVQNEWIHPKACNCVGI